MVVKMKIGLEVVGSEGDAVDALDGESPCVEDGVQGFDLKHKDAVIVPPFKIVQGVGMMLGADSKDPADTPGAVAREVERIYRFLCGGDLLDLGDLYAGRSEVKGCADEVGLTGVLYSEKNREVEFLADAAQFGQ